VRLSLGSMVVTGGSKTAISAVFAWVRLRLSRMPSAGCLDKRFEVSWPDPP
jgi:hypothetical protein